MTTLFRRINPTQNFRITKRQIAKFLRIPESQIVKIQSWLYVIATARKLRTTINSQSTLLKASNADLS